MHQENVKNTINTLTVTCQIKVLVEFDRTGKN